MPSPPLQLPGAALFPDAGERTRINDWLTRELRSVCERIAAGPVNPRLDIATLRSELSQFDFATPRALEEVLSWAMTQMEHGLVHLTHPRYFGLFNPSPTFPAECADRIVGAVNPQLASSATSPAAVEIEAHVIRAIATRAGLPPTSGGHFTSGGSEANCTALLCALTQAGPESASGGGGGFAQRGARAFAGDPVFYTSRDCHIAWLKIAHQVGIGRDALQLVATDGRGRMDAVALANAIAEDRARGRVPVMIVSTAGTTGAGIIDPLAQCAEIAREQRLWHHVDAAWGGAVIASERLRGLLAGIEQADSVTIDAHKWFATTMGCGMFITRHPSLLWSVFQASATFMPSQVASLDPYVNTLQWSRRFLGLRLFLSLAATGWSGYGAHVERAVALMDSLKSRLLGLGWQVVNDSSLAVLNAVPPAGSAPVKTIVERVVKSGCAWVAPTRFEGQDAVRVCATHGESDENDLHQLVAALQAAR
jgi:glutamate/tyrosine decarboxylase-like PLP-dependent enzyme